MRAMVLRQQKQPLVMTDMPIPVPTDSQVLLRVNACGLCRTDLHVVDGDLQEPSLPLIPGHQIVGEIVSLGLAVSGLRTGQRVGVPWLGEAAATATIVAAARKTCALRRVTRVISSMVVLRSTQSQKPPTVSLFRTVTATCKRRRCFVQA